MTQKPLQITSSVRTGSKANCAEFFSVSLPTVESWIRKGMPVVQRGAKGVAWVIDLCAAAEWRFAAPADSETDPDLMEPGDRDKWYAGQTKKRDLQVRDGELLEASDADRTFATALAALSNDMKSIPDDFERKHGIAPEHCILIEGALFVAMERMAATLATRSPSCMHECDPE